MAIDDVMFLFWIMEMSLVVVVGVGKMSARYQMKSINQSMNK